ncbi:MAG TPA: condensation domain-containing protein, partial [Pyrinomonadaceae bacterium]
MDDLSQRLETLSPAKRALLERRLRADKPDRPQELLLSRKSRRDSARASFAQERLWFMQQLEPGSAAYNVPRAIRIVGKLELEALERSLNEIIVRHESLRTRFAMEDGILMQRIAQSCPLQISVDDLSYLPTAEATAKANEIAKVEATLPFDLSLAPVVRARMLRLGPDEHLLLLTLHHIVSDAWSAGILFQELITLYREFSAHRNSPLPPLKLQYGDYAEWQRDWLQGDVLQE